MTSTTDPTIISRSEWHARPPKEIKHLTNPVEYVVVHHSYKPGACYNLEDCVKAMQWMQDLHQINNSWADIGYNFAVGSDGRVYEGRGWTRVGAHAPTYNFYSIGICMIGDWRGRNFYFMYRLTTMRSNNPLSRKLLYIQKDR